MYSQHRTKGALFREETLDYEFSYGDEITITPRNYQFNFKKYRKHEYPLCNTGIMLQEIIRFIMMPIKNEKGLGIAGLTLLWEMPHTIAVENKTNIA